MFISYQFLINPLGLLFICSLKLEWLFFSQKTFTFRSIFMKIKTKINQNALSWLQLCLVCVVYVFISQPAWNAIIKTQKWNSCSFTVQFTSKKELHIQQKQDPNMPGIASLSLSNLQWSVTPFNFANFFFSLLLQQLHMSTGIISFISSRWRSTAAATIWLTEWMMYDGFKWSLPRLIQSNNVCAASKWHTQMAQYCPIN